MHRINDCESGAFEWVQRGTGPRTFELVADAAVHGRLQWEKGRGSLALGEAEDGRWTFKRSGFLRPRATVRAAGTETDVAVYVPGLGSGALRLADGRLLLWGRKGLWNPTWTFREADERPLLNYRAGSGWTKLGGEMEIEDDARSFDLLSLLALFGWYLVVLEHDDDELAAITAATMAAS